MTGVRLILSGNGPGELTGWIAPVARAAKRLASEAGTPLRITLALSPSQFAGGRELEVVRAWQLFDEIIPPAAVVRLALGAGGDGQDGPGALVHLGGDLSISGRLAARLRVPAAALAETTLIARRHQLFRRIFAVSSGVADRLAGLAVPAGKITVSGDPRSDAFAEAPRIAASSERGRSVLSLMPGSRDRFFAVMTPYLTAAADAMEHLGVRARVNVIVSEFLSPPTVDRVRAEVAQDHPGLDITWVGREPWTAVGSSDLVVTIPGTNTLELAMLGVPFAVVVEEEALHVAPLEGMAEWIARIPALGPAFRRAAARGVLRRLKYVALPNARAGRMVVPEWVGRWTPEDLAKRVADLLNDPARREAIAAELRGLGLRTPGAAEHVAAGALAMAERTS